MDQFKGWEIGDTVECVDLQGNDCVCVGKRYEITDIAGIPIISCDSPYDKRHPITYGQFELVDKKAGPW